MPNTSILILLAALAAVPAHAGGINLSWNDCGNAGLLNEDFACNTNAGNHALIVSFEPDAAMSDMSAMIARLDVQNTMPIPPWWQLYNPDACRQTVPTANLNFAANAACTDIWSASGVAISAIAQYQVGIDAPNRARLIVIAAMPDGVPVAPGTEYYGVRILIANTKTVGTGSCFGCEAPGCVVLASVELQPNGSGPSQMITGPRDRNAVIWQGGTAYGCIAVPIARRTWGGIKTLYR